MLLKLVKEMSHVIKIESVELTKVSSLFFATKNCQLARKNYSVFKCSRCEMNFGQNQDAFEDHVEQCKAKEEISLSSSIRNYICKICYGRFEQTPVTCIHFLSCGHLFHKICFIKIKELTKNCPTCKLEYKKDCNGSFDI